MDIFKITRELDNIDEIVWSNEKEFLEKFTINGTDLVEVYYGPFEVFFSYVLDCGQTVCDTIKIQKLQDWFEDLEKK